MGLRRSHRNRACQSGSAFRLNGAMMVHWLALAGRMQSSKTSHHGLAALEPRSHGHHAHLSRRHGCGPRHSAPLMERADWRAYPESGYFKSPDWVFTEISPDDLIAQLPTGWHAANSVIALGGCCGIGAVHIISALAKGVCSMIKGSCLCGGVAFEVSRAACARSSACHCTQCRKQSGHFGAFTACDDTGPAFHLRKKHLHGTAPATRRDVAFCKACGSLTVLEGRWHGLHVDHCGCAWTVRRASRMEGHIYCADKGDYYEILDGSYQKP